MKAIVEINLSTPQAVSLLGYLESLPYTKVKKSESGVDPALLEAAGPGALTLEEFGVSMEKAIREAYRA